MKKLLFLFFALVALSAQSWAYDFSYTYQGQTLYYNIVNGNAEVTRQNGSYPYYTTYPTGSLTIPSSVTYNGTTYSVTSIGVSAFSGCSSLTSVTIPNSVTSIGNDAFYGCSGLTSVYYTGDVAGWCGITFGYRDANPLYYAHNLYINGSLVTDLVIPSGVTEIKNYTFYGATCLTSVTIPNSVTSIGYSALGGSNAFYGCSGLTSVYYTGNVAGWCGITFGDRYANPLYYAHNLYINGSLVTDLVIPSGVTEIKNYTFCGATCLTSVTIPNSVTSISFFAFSGCSGLTSVTIPNSVTSIGDYAFYYCSGLTSVTIGNSVTSIGIRAFDECSGLTEIHSLNPVPPAAGGTYDGTFYSAFGVVPTNIPVYIPCGRLSYYTSAQGWSSFTNFIEGSAASFSAVSNDNSMGTVQVLTMPTCTNPQAVVYAVANSGYEFDHWSDNSTSNPYSLTVNEDMELTAYFSPIGSQPTTYYTITVSVNDADMGTATGGGSFAEGTTTTITATANNGYHFVQWQDGNTEASRSITVTSNATYTAYFAANGANEYTITVIAQNPTMGSTTGSGTFAYGTATTITAEPYEGYYFVQWNDGNTQRIRTITVTGNATYTAYFDGTNGIDDITSDQIKIYSRGSEIVIEGADNSDALVYDVMGRIVHKGRIESPIHVNALGVYMVKIGNRQPQKVVVR